MNEEKSIANILKMSFKCGFAAGVGYAIGGGEVANREQFEKRCEEEAEKALNEMLKSAGTRMEGVVRGQ